MGVNDAPSRLVPAVSDRRHNPGGATAPVTSRRMPLTIPNGVTSATVLPERATAAPALTGALRPTVLQP